ncbi:MAG: molybdate ABC transporter substrate-binding protein [Caldimonas sp.]
MTSAAIRAGLRRCAAGVVLALGCLGGHAADLTVSAAASLSDAFRALGPVFEAQHPGTQVVFNFAASDALLAQIAKGAPVDVFAAADQESMDRADAHELLAPGSRRNFASNTLVLVVPGDSGLALASLADLQRPEVRRIALGTPSGVPAGRYARGALDAARAWTAVEPKAVYAQNVRQSLDYVARGEVEAGFVYATDAAIQKDKVKVAFVVPTATPIAYPIAAVAGSPNPEAARRFVAFVLAPAAQAVLARYGFGKP